MSPHQHWGFAPSRIEPNRPRFPSLWCRVRVGTPRSANPAQPRWHSTRVVSALADGQAGEWRSGRGAPATHPRHALAARPALGTLARTSAIRSGVAATNPCAPPRQRVGEARPAAAGGRPATPRNPTTTVRRRRSRPTHNCCFPREASARLAPRRDARCSSQAVVSSAETGTPACARERERRSCPRIVLLGHIPPGDPLLERDLHPARPHALPGRSAGDELAGLMPTIFERVA